MTARGLRHTFNRTVHESQTLPDHFFVILPLYSSLAVNRVLLYAYAYVRVEYGLCLNDVRDIHGPDRPDCITTPWAIRPDPVLRDAPPVCGP